MHIIRPLVLSAFVICATTSCCGHLGGDRLSDRSNLTEYVGATVKAHGGDAIVHTNISSQAFIGGEAWFDGNAVTIDAGSGRFGDRSGLPARVWQGAIRYWQHLGYEVNAIPFGQR